MDGGIPGFQHSRIFYNRNYKLEIWQSAQGTNWAVNEWPYLVKRVHAFPGGEQETIVLKEGLYPLWFDKQEDGTFLARYGADDRSSLIHIPAEGIYRYEEVSSNGVETVEFQDFAQPPARAGMFKRRVDSEGFETTVIAYGNKTIAGLQTIRGDSTYRLTYSLITSGNFSGKLDTVTLERETTSGVEALRRARYLYHTGNTEEGAIANLKAAITQQPAAGGGWEDIAVRYYRYAKGLLTYVVGPTVYMKLKEFGQDVLTMTRSSGGPDLVPQFANNYFEYDEVNRVTREVARGTAESTSSEGLTYIRSRNPHVPHNQHTPRTEKDFNTWAWKTVEDGRDDFRLVVYTNKIGQPLAEVKQSLSDPERQWIRAYRRDATGATVLSASPAAVAGIDETFPDLVGYRDDGTFALLRADKGLVTRTEYYTVTTATSAVAGGVKGYVKKRTSHEGWNGAAIPESETTYLASANTSGPVTYVTASETVFRTEEDTPASRVTTSYAYIWHPGSRPRILERVTTMAAVPITEGGDGIAHTRREMLDLRGNVTWEMDERGVVTKREYDVARSLRTRETLDADTVPSGWTVLPGAHLALTTDFFYDALGRLERSLGPEHEAIVGGSAILLRRADFQCTVDMPLSGQSLFGRPVLNQVRRATGYRLSSTGDENIINPVTIDLMDKCGRTLHTIASKRTTGAGSLSASDTFMRAEWSRWQANLYESRGLLAAQRVYWNIPALAAGLEGVFDNIGVEELNYDETRYGYAKDYPFLVRQRDAEGTITRTVYDDAGRPAATFVGLDDEAEGSTWEDWEPGAPGTDLVLVSAQEYDGGKAGGDSFLTEITAHATESEVRSTRYRYDFRGRTIVEIGGDGLYIETDYDNLGQVVETRSRNGDASGNLVSKESSFTNALRQVYEVRSYSVDPETGAVGDYLRGLRKYDAVGNLLWATEPGQGNLKSVSEYDNVGRTITTYAEVEVSDGGSEIPVIVERMVTTLDAGSNVLSSDRFQLNAGAAPSAPNYRASYQHVWYDPSGRSIASADLGARATPPVRPATPLARADDVLVTDMVFNERGEFQAQVDPLGREKRYNYDDKGRLVKSVDNYVAPGKPGEPNSGCNRTTRIAYTPDDQQRELVVEGKSPPLSSYVYFPEITRWEYGVSLGRSSIASNKLLAGKIYADGTAETYAYNRQGQATERKDANGTIHVYRYDALGRPEHDCVMAAGPKIHSTLMRQTVVYNPRGLTASLQGHSSPDPAKATAVNEVHSTFDGFGALIAEAQEHYGLVRPDGVSSTKTVVYGREGISVNQNRISRILYPSGKEYFLKYGAPGSLDDRLGRVVEVREAVSGGDLLLASYVYMGFDAVVRKTLPQPSLSWDLWGGVEGSYEGLDLFARVTDLRWQAPGGDKARLEYGYDRGGRRLYRRDAVAIAATKSFDELYAYDGLDQLKSLRRGVLDTSRTDLEAESETFNEAFVLDDIGNWFQYEQGSPETTLEQTRWHDSTNMLTKIVSPPDSPKWAHPRHDEVGNMTRVPGAEDAAKPFRVDYDAWNRVSRVATFDSAWRHLRVAQYVYDARGWRVQTLVFVEGGLRGSLLSETLDHYYDAQWREIETWATRAPTPPSPDDGWVYFQPVFRERKVWDQGDGLYLDSLIFRDLDEDGDGDGQIDNRVYVLQDAHYNTVAVTDESGDVLERFAYSAFGTPQVFDAGFDPLLISSNNWEVLFSGYSRERGSGLYYVRHRYYHPKLGRWVSRDPMVNAEFYEDVNLYRAFANKPISAMDFSGMEVIDVPIHMDFEGRSAQGASTGFVVYRTLTRLTKIAVVDYTCDKTNASLTVNSVKWKDGEAASAGFSFSAFFLSFDFGTSLTHEVKTRFVPPKCIEYTITVKSQSNSGVKFTFSKGPFGIDSPGTGFGNRSFYNRIKIVCCCE